MPLSAMSDRPASRARASALAGTRQEVEARANAQLAQIARHGYDVLACCATMDTNPPRPAFASTLGLQRFDRADLIIIGLPPPTARMILSTLAEHALKIAPLPTEAPLSGFFSGLAPILRCLAVEAAHAWPFTSADLRTGKGFRFTQVIWPDTHGNYPWEADFDSALHAAQPMLATVRP